MKEDVDLGFVCRTLSIFNSFYGLSSEDVWWRTDGEYAPITLLVNCNDFFSWGCSDCEEITPENVEVMEQCAKDMRDATGSCRYADLLFCSRVRKMRPQGAFYPHLPKESWPLFDAAGPERGTDTWNPKKHPSAA